MRPGAFWGICWGPGAPVKNSCIGPAPTNRARPLFQTPLGRFALKKSSGLLAEKSDFKRVPTRPPLGPDVALNCDVPKMLDDAFQANFDSEQKTAARMGEKPPSRLSRPKRPGGLGLSPPAATAQNKSSLDFKHLPCVTVLASKALLSAPC